MRAEVNHTKCIWSLITINDPISYIALPIWFLLLLTLWLVSIIFIFFLIKTPQKQVKTNKKKFDGLMICASILSSITFTLLSIMKLLEIHLKFPLKSVDYTNISYCGDITQENNNNIVKSMFETIIMMCTILAPLSWLMTINVYYYRLILTFNGSSFALNKCHTIYFGCMIILSLFLVAVSVASRSTSMTVLFGIFFVLLYVVTCIVLCVMLRQRLIGMADFQISSMVNKNSNSNSNSKNKGNGSGSGKGTECILYHLLERFSILAYWTIIATLIYIMIVIIDNFIIGQTTLLQFIEFIFALLNAINDVVCMACQFNFANIIYCNICQKFSNLFFKKQTSISVINKNNTNNDDKKNTSIPQVTTQNP